MKQWNCDYRRAVGLSTEPLAVRVKVECATGEYDWNAKAQKAMMLFRWSLCGTAATTLLSPSHGQLRWLVMVNSASCVRGARKQDACVHGRNDIV